MLQLRYPELRSVLITGLDSGDARGVGAATCAALAASGREAVLGAVGWGQRPKPDTGHHLAVPAGVRCVDMSDRDRLLDVRSARRLVAECTGMGIAVLVTEDFLKEAQSAVLAACVDGVLLVTRAGRTRHNSLREARVRLDSVSAHLLGAVFVTGQVL